MKIEDYLKGYQSLPPSDVLRLWLEDNTKLVIRPSGTEPKIKIYLEVVGEGNLEEHKLIEQCDERLQRLAHFFRKYTNL